MLVMNWSAMNNHSYDSTIANKQRRECFAYRDYLDSI